MTNEPSFAAVCKLGDQLAACVFNGFVEVDVPSAMPTVGQRIVVEACNHLRAKGIEPTPQTMVESAAELGYSEADQAALAEYGLMPNVVAMRYYGPDCPDAWDLRDYVLEATKAHRARLKREKLLATKAAN